jgi:hypothetical protein
VLCKKELERIYWCCEWEGAVSHVKRMKISKVPPTLLQKIFLSQKEVDACPGGKIIMNVPTDADATRICDKGRVGKALKETGTVVDTSKDVVCQVSLVQKVKGTLQSIFSFMSFGWIKEPTPLTCT